MEKETGIEEKQVDPRLLDLATGYQTDPSSSLLGDLIGVIVRNIETIAPWWSRARDNQLREFWKDGDALSGIMGVAENKLASIPIKVVARDKSIVLHRKQAERLTDLLTNNSDFGLGLHNMMLKFSEDYLGQDNGAFMEILGAGNPTGPITGPVMGMRHLDSAYCIRTSDPIFPVLYHAEDGKQYKMHNARIIYMSQMPSAHRKMNNVGFCSVSRSLRIAQNAHNVLNYQDEKMGARAASQILVGSGISGKEIIKAMAASDYMMDSLGLKNLAKTVAIGSATGEIDLKRIELNSLDPFDEEVFKTFTTYALAIAWGLDIQELMPVAATRQSDTISLQRTRTRLQHMFIKAFMEQANMKLVPPYLKIEMDYVDDQADQQHAVIEDITSRNFERQMSAGVTTPQVVQQIMYERGYINRSQLRSMQLSQGKLENGLPVQSLFFNSKYNNLLPIDRSFLVPSNNERDAAIKAIEENEVVIYTMLGDSGSGVLQSMADEALRALEWLREKYEFMVEPQPEQLQQPEQENMAYQDGKLRNQDTGEVGKATNFFTSNNMMVEN